MKQSLQPSAGPQFNKDRELLDPQGTRQGQLNSSGSGVYGIGGTGDQKPQEYYFCHNNNNDN